MATGNGAAPGHNSGGSRMAGELRSYVERIERLEAEKAAIATDITEVYAEASKRGYGTKALREVVRLRRMSLRDREEHEALVDLYKAALGMLNDTPLGAAALRRLNPTPPKPPQQPPPGPADEPGLPLAAESAPPADDAPATPPPPAAPLDPLAGKTVDDARAMGSQAAAASQPVSVNPFPAGDPRRAAFDEAWCQASGSDGMEIPAAWRRTPKPPKAKPPQPPPPGDDAPAPGAGA